MTKLKTYYVLDRAFGDFLGRVFVRTKAEAMGEARNLLTRLNLPPETPAVVVDQSGKQCPISK